MSFHEYVTSREIAAQDYPFYALIMAAMRKADANNAEKLRKAFGDTWAELHDRYHAPGGVLDWMDGIVNP
jgi:hypothetical protein